VTTALEELRAELIRTSVGTQETITTVTEAFQPVINVRMPASCLGHFVDLLGADADDIEVELRLDPTEPSPLLEAMKVAPDLGTWASPLGAAAATTQ
jgi:hypothetical protein